MDVVPTSYETRVMLRGWCIPDGNLSSRWPDLARGLEGSAESEPGADGQGALAGPCLVIHRGLLPLVSAAITTAISDTAVLQHEKLLQ